MQCLVIAPQGQCGVKSGIYCLKWPQDGLVYVGLSQNICARLKEHKKALRKGKHSNYKVQRTYDKLGPPETSILELCEIKELNEREKYWTEKLNSIRNGLNIVEAGRVGFGVNSNSSKYSKMQVLRVFSLLYKTSLSHSQIAKRVKTHKSLVSDISSGVTHVWLKSSYPEAYSTMIGKVKSRGRSKYNTAPVVFISPTGAIITTNSIIKLTMNIVNNKDATNEIKNISSGLARVANGKSKHYKGWALYTHSAI